MKSDTVEKGIVDWAAFDAWLTEESRPHHEEAARAIMSELGDELAPEHLDALPARREAAGASIEELVVLKQAGEDLVRFQRRARVGIAAEDVRCRPPTPLHDAECMVDGAPGASFVLA